MAHCHLTGGHPARVVKAAPIVPKSLNYGEVSICSVSAKLCCQTRRMVSVNMSLSQHSAVTDNGVVTVAITLESTIECALDSGLVVLAPMPPKEGEATKWKCVITDKFKKNDMVYQGVHWKVGLVTISRYSISNRSRISMEWSWCFCVLADRDTGSYTSGS